MHNTGYDFRAKTLDPKRRVVLYEVVPPEPHTTVKALRRSASALVKTLKGFGDVDAIYVPEITDENDRHSAVVRAQKVPAQKFAAYIKLIDPNADLIITHPFRYYPRDQTEQWLRETYRAGIRNVVIVGPSKEREGLTGYKVGEAAELIRFMNSRSDIDIFPGGIAMDCRKNEPERMVAKAQSGVMYFTTQLFFDADSMIKLLEGYKRACDERSIEPRRVFLSVSPVSSQGTLKVIEGLIETNLDEELKSYLFRRDHGIGNRSIQRIEEMITRLFDYVYGENVNVPLGLCVEHVTDSNFRYALELLDRLPRVWKNYLPDSELPTPTA